MENCANFSDPSSASQTELEKRARDIANELHSAIDWRLEPHVCRHCFGRLVSRPLHGDLREYQCTNCEATAQHTDATQACCCGIQIRKRNGAGRSGGPMVDAGIRCIPNPERSPAFPGAYVASEVVKTKR